MPTRSLAAPQGLSPVEAKRRLAAFGFSARGLAFTALIAAKLGLVLVNRSWTMGLWRSLTKPNPAAWIVIAAAAAVLSLALGLPAARGLFHFTATDPASLAGAGAIGAMAALWFEIPKAFGLLRRLS
jgi:P-type Ca2+ transporter type 2C